MEYSIPLGRCFRSVARNRVSWIRAREHSVTGRVYGMYPVFNVTLSHRPILVKIPDLVMIRVKGMLGTKLEPGEQV